jgi:uncharacterized protein
MRKLIQIIAAAVALLTVAVAPAAAETTSGHAKHDRHSARPVGRVLQLAQRGDARAQAELGLMYATGRYVPQSFEGAILWYRRAAEQGEPTAQYFLGLMYDKGQGVTADSVTAHKWLILATAQASGRQREYYARVRDAIAFKLSQSEIDEAQHLAAEWRPVPER